MRGENREAAGAGAQLQHGAHLLGIFHVGLQTVLQQFADERTRHDHAFVHVEAEAVHPRFLRDVGGRHALGGAALDHVQHGVDFSRGQARVEKRVQRVERQMQRVQDQIGGFVVGIGRAVAERQIGLVEARDREAQQVANGGKRERHRK